MSTARSEQKYPPARQAEYGASRGGLPVRNRSGLRPARLPDGSPAPLEIAGALDRWRLMDGVTTFNHHAHLPHFQRLSNRGPTHFPAAC